MIEHELFVQTRAKTGQVSQALQRVATSANYERVLATVAYATKKGAQHLARMLESESSQWRQMRKEWLVSIDNGVTEPGALEFLDSLPKSNVYVPGAEELLTTELRPRTLFHNKLYLFDGDGNDEAIGLLSGSANLTLGGLCFNNEQVAISIWTPPLQQSENASYENIKEQRTVLEQLFASATPLDDQILQRYRSLRESRESEDDTGVVQQIVVPDPILDQSEAIALATATAFWVDIRRETENLGRGLPGNQVDLKRGSRVFFGFSADNVPRNSFLGTINIKFGRHRVDCNMRFGNNSMDKLNLPVPGGPGPETYRNQILLFQHRRDGAFDLRIGSEEEIREWKRRSQQQDSLFYIGRNASDGREYGVFN